MGGDPALPNRQGFANFFDDRAVLADPALAMSVYNGILSGK